MRTAELNLTALCAGTTFVCVDIETTDSDTGKHVVSFGVAPWRHGKRVQGAFEVLTNPGVAIENPFIHGITDDDVASKPAFPKVASRLTDALKPSRDNRVVLVAHFASSDLATLKREYERARRRFPDVPVLDTHALAKHLRIGRGGYGLRDVLAAYGLEPTQHHNALADARDTATILERLLREAAEQGHRDLLALIDDAQGARTTTAHYEAGPTTRTAPRDHTSAFVYIERPDEHIKDHRKLKKGASSAARKTWMNQLRECIDLRCPLLVVRADDLPDHHLDVAQQLKRDLDTHAAAGDVVATNTTLLALVRVLRRAQLTPEQAVAWFDQLDASLNGHTRCVSPGISVQDGCPSCRGDRACPADVWQHGLAATATARSNTTRYLEPWTRVDGHLDKLADDRPRYARALARVIAVRLNDAGTDALPLAIACQRLGIVEPKVAHVHARSLVGAHDYTGALTVIDATTPHRNGSTDRAWSDLALYRSAVIARQRWAQPAKRTMTRPDLAAPANRPRRRRFTAVR